MLVISRKRDEKLVIGDSIEISVVEIRGDKVRIGVTCPADVPVHRHEVYEAIRRYASSPVEPSPPIAPPAKVAPPAVRIITPPAAPITVTLPGPDVSRLDKLREAGGLSREAALGTVLEVIDQAGITTLCELERRLDR